EAKSLALAAQVAGLHQHTCYAARYLGSGNIFCIKFQWLAENYWKNVLVSRTGPLTLKKTNRSLPGVGWTSLLGGSLKGNQETRLFSSK
ncbi:MAG: hypothetical protein V2B20_14980, partial [Pseudomonadota bacterium]